MIRHIFRFAEIAATVGAVSGIAYYLLCLWSAADFLREKRAAGKGGPSTPSAPSPVSILKPLKGLDPGMYGSLRSHCLQDYPEYEIIFGVSDADDAAVVLVDQLKAEFPHLAIRLIVCAKNSAANVKVGNLSQLVIHARHDYLLVSDSDIRVRQNYLQRVIAPLRDAKVGLVTCLYRGVPTSSLASELESVGISTDFVPGVLTARTLENGIRFGLGSTLAFRRADLVAIGGFESLADYLADDYQLGKRIVDAGLKVVLSDEIVETFLPAYTFSAFVRHQLRWARTIRDSRYWGSMGLIFTFAIPWAALAVLFSHENLWQWALLAVALGVRLSVAILVGNRILGDRNMARLAWMIPVRDGIAIFLWAASFMGNTVVWRGQRFRLERGRLIRAR